MKRLLWLGLVVIVLGSGAFLYFRMSKNTTTNTASTGIKLSESTVSALDTVGWTPFTVSTKDTWMFTLKFPTGWKPDPNCDLVTSDRYAALSAEGECGPLLLDDYDTGVETVDQVYRKMFGQEPSLKWITLASGTKAQYALMTTNRLNHYYFFQLGRNVIVLYTPAEKTNSWTEEELETSIKIANTMTFDPSKQLQ